MHTAVLHAVALGRLVRKGRVSDNAGKNHEIALLKEELPIKDLRMARVAAACRPQYSPQERMAILESIAARGWSAIETAPSLLVTESTVVSWLSRLDE